MTRMNFKLSILFSALTLVTPTYATAEKDFTEEQWQAMHEMQRLSLPPEVFQPSLAAPLNQQSNFTESAQHLEKASKINEAILASGSKRQRDNAYVKSQAKHTSKSVKQQAFNEDNLQDTYFLYIDGPELSFLSFARVTLGNGTGSINLTSGTIDFTWILDDEGFIVTDLGDGFLISEGFVFVSGQSQSALRQTYLTQLEFKPQIDNNNQLTFSWEAQYTDRYPGGELEENSSWYNSRLLAARKNQQLNLSETLPVNKLFQIPSEITYTKRFQTENSDLTKSAINRSMRVMLQELNSQSATGFWEYLIINDDGKEEHEVEVVNVTFNADGSATFLGNNGLKVELSALRRQRDNETVVNAVVSYHDTFSNKNIHTLAIDSKVTLKNENLSHSAPGIYQFKQNGLDDSYFWFEFNEDGTAISVSVFDQNGDGQYTADEFFITPYLWAYTDEQDGIDVDLRRYRYRSGTNKFGDCIPDRFSPAPDSECVLFNSRIIDFYEKTTLNNQTIIETEHQSRLYSTHWGSQNNDNLLQVVVDSRYYYLLNERPLALPVIPENDNFNNATAIIGSSGIISGTTLNAGREPGEICHANVCNNATVWYSYTADKNGRLELNLTTNSDTLPNIAIYDGNSLSNLTPFGRTRISETGISWVGTVKQQTPVKIAIANDRQVADQSFTLRWDYTEARRTAISSIHIEDPQLKYCITITGHEFAEDVTSMFCNGVTNLQGIENFTSLEVLALNGQTWNINDLRIVTDLSPLTKLENLSYLSLSNNQLTNDALKTLGNFRFDALKFTVLDLTGNMLDERSIDFIKEITQESLGLQLNIPQNEFTHLSNIFKLENLRSIYIGGPSIKDLPSVTRVLSDMPQLFTIGLINLNLTTLENLSFPSSLYSLDISQNPISSFEKVTAFVNMDSLHLLNANATNITNLNGLSSQSLKILYVGNTQLQDLTEISNLPNLDTLSISNTFVKDIEPLFTLEHIRSIFIGDNTQITCSALERLRQAKPNLSLQQFGVCKDDEGFSFTLEQFQGSIVTGVVISPWNGGDISEFGTITWINGKLIFTPKKGFFGNIVLNLLVQTQNGNWLTTFYLNIPESEAKPKRRKGIPIWLLTTQPN